MAIFPRIDLRIKIEINRLVMSSELKPILSQPFYKYISRLRFIRCIQWVTDYFDQYHENQQYQTFNILRILCFLQQFQAIRASLIRS